MKMHYLETATQPYTIQKPVHELERKRSQTRRRGEEMDNVTLYQGHFRHSRSSGARHSDLQNEEESTEIDSGGYQRKFRSGQTSARESPVALGYFG